MTEQTSAISLVVVPTNGSVRDESGQLAPSDVCQMRIHTAAGLLMTWPRASLVIVGGQRKESKNAEAWVAKRFFVNEYPALKESVAIVDASAKYTAADMQRIAPTFLATARCKPGRKLRITIVSHPDHGRMAKRYLRDALEKMPNRRTIRVVYSGEPAPYSKLQLKILRWVNRCDPEWKRWPSAPLRWLANRRGRQDDQ